MSFVCTGLYFSRAPCLLPRSKPTWCHRALASHRKLVDRSDKLGVTSKLPQEELAVFWDARGQLLPSRGQAAGLWANISRVLSAHGRIVEQYVYYDVHDFHGSAESMALEMAGFGLANCALTGVASIDKRLTADAMQFAWRSINVGRASVISIISADAGHAYMLHKIRGLGLKTIVINPRLASESIHFLTESADVSLDWKSIVEASSMDRSMTDVVATELRDVSSEKSQLPIVLDASARTLEQPRLDVCGSAPETVACGKDKMWQDMTSVERNAAGLLGYDLNSWDVGASPPRCLQSWRRLGDEEQNAASLLGYNEIIWDAELQSLSGAVESVHSHVTKNNLDPFIIDVGVDSMHRSDELAPDVAVHTGNLDSTISADLLELLSDDIELGLVAPPRRESMVAVTPDSHKIQASSTFSQDEGGPECRPHLEHFFEKDMLHRMLQGR